MGKVGEVVLRERVAREARARKLRGERGRSGGHRPCGGQTRHAVEHADDGYVGNRRDPGRLRNRLERLSTRAGL